MKEINLQQDEYPDEIGSIARMLDVEMTALERMKITRHNLTRVSFAVIFYIITMLIFSTQL